MIEELLMQKDQEETNKMMEKIHEQAYWRKVEDDRARILNNLNRAEQKKKAQKKEWLNKCIEATTLIISITPIVMALLILGAK